MFGEYFGKKPIFADDEGKYAYIADTSEMSKTFGVPGVDFNTLVKWQASWLIENGRTINKPTHFEETGGNY